MLPNLIAQFVD